MISIFYTHVINIILIHCIALSVGMRRYSVNLICGSLMRILPLLETTLLKHGLKLKLRYDIILSGPKA